MEIFLMCSVPVRMSVWLQMSWYCLEIEWFGIKTINISLSFDGDPGWGWKIKCAKNDVTTASRPVVLAKFFEKSHKLAWEQHYSMTDHMCNAFFCSATLKQLVSKTQIHLKARKLYFPWHCCQRNSIVWWFSFAQTVKGHHFSQPRAISHRSDAIENKCQV